MKKATWLKESVLNKYINQWFLHIFQIIRGENKEEVTWNQPELSLVESNYLKKPVFVSCCSLNCYYLNSTSLIGILLLLKGQDLQKPHAVYLTLLYFALVLGKRNQYWVGYSLLVFRIFKFLLSTCDHRKFFH